MALDSVLFIPEDKGGRGEFRKKRTGCQVLTAGGDEQGVRGRWEQNEVGGGQGTHSTLHPASLCFRSDAETGSS